MGIQGLIPLLEKSSSTVNVSQFSGCTVAIDTYCWLHKGLYSCAEKLARGEDNQAYVHYCMRFVSMLLANNIKPILVFDGQKLPAKADTESKRRKQRDENRKKAAELLRLGKTNEASSLLKRSIDVTHKMALNLIKRCREINVDCIVAPYEADSQLAYLNMCGIAHVVITEDSDLLLFGCKRVLFKMDQNGGGLLIEQEKLYLSMNIPPEQFSFNKFRYMCILSGCDYLPSVPGVGLIKARQFITRTTDPDIYKSLSRLGTFINTKVPSDYRDQFMNADRTFQYQPVYDPLSRQIIPLNKLPNSDLPLLVSNLTPNQAYKLALGNIDPISLEEMDNWDPDARITPKKNVNQACHKSIWSKDYQLSKYVPIIRPKTIKKLSLTLPTDKSLKEPIKILPVTEDEVLSTLEEIYSSEKVSEENEVNANKNSMLENFKTKKHEDIIENCVLTPEIDDIVVENGTPNIFKQSTKRKYTVINPEKQVVSKYFTPPTPKCNEIVDDKEKCLNPFKCRKVVIPQEKENTTEDLNTSSSFIHSVEENKSKNEEFAIELPTDKLHRPSTIQKAFCWNNYSKTNSEGRESTNNVWISQNESNSINNDDNDNDTQKTDNDNDDVDIDEGFCSQNLKESNITPKAKKRLCPRTGLSKNALKKGQTLLSKFGFKTSEQLKR